MGNMKEVGTTGHSPVFISVYPYSISVKKGGSSQFHIDIETRTVSQKWNPQKLMVKCNTNKANSLDSLCLGIERQKTKLGLFLNINFVNFVDSSDFVSFHIICIVF